MTENPYGEGFGEHRIWNEGYNQAIEDAIAKSKMSRLFAEYGEIDVAELLALRKVSE